MARFGNILKKLIKMAETDDDVLAVLLFGSVARGEKNGKDLDICLVFKKDTDKNKIFEKMVEYASISDIVDVKAFQLLPLHMRMRVIREGKILHVKNEDLVYDVVISTLREFEEFKFIYHSYLEGVLNG